MTLRDRLEKIPGILAIEEGEEDSRDFFEVAVAWGDEKTADAIYAAELETLQEDPDYCFDLTVLLRGRGW